MRVSLHPLLNALVIKLGGWLIKCFLEHAIAAAEEGFGRSVPSLWPASCVAFGLLEYHVLLKDAQEAVKRFLIVNMNLVKASALINSSKTLLLSKERKACLALWISFQWSMLRAARVPFCWPCTTVAPGKQLTGLGQYSCCWSKARDDSFPACGYEAAGVLVAQHCRFLSWFRKPVMGIKQNIQHFTGEKLRH